jgi:hypothetical protein
MTAAEPKLPQICCQDRQANDKQFDNVLCPWQIFQIKNDTTLTIPAALQVLESFKLTHLGKMMQPDKPNWIKGQVD